MQNKKTLQHGNISVTIEDDHLDVVSEPPSEAKDTAGFGKIWVLADIYVIEKGKADHKNVANQRDDFPKGITFEVPLPSQVLNDDWVKQHGKNRLSIVYYNKNARRWIKFPNQQVDLDNNKATVTLRSWIKDPPVGWGGDQPH